MQFNFQAVLLALLSTASAITVSYDVGYDQPSRSLTTVACSDGSNGMITKGYLTQGAIPSFPSVGGAFSVGGWNSPNCGGCYEIVYNGKTVHMTAIDHTATGFNLGKRAMDYLTGGRAEQVGRVDASYKKVAAKFCKL